MNIKYIDNNQQKGILIDWNLIFKEFKKLKCPPDVYDPTTFPINVVNWGVILSDRSKGKTTNWLLIGLLLYKHYGIQTGYIRQTDAMTKSTKTRELFNVVEEFGYIQKLFGKQWNSIYLWQKHFYLCNRDENGKVIDKSEDDFCMVLSVDKSYDYKSTLTKPRMDLLIFDEFISNKYAPDEFILLCQLISTVRRKKISTKIVCLSNMVTPYSQYLEEMGLRQTALVLKPGQSEIVKTILGLDIYFEILDGNKMTDKKAVSANISYFGFANKKLSAITGSDWEIRNYPHLTRPKEGENRTVVTRDLYIYCFDKYICMEIWKSSEIGYYMNFRPYPLTVPEKGIIFSDQIPTRKNEFYGTAKGTKFSKLWKLWQQHRDFYSSNEVGHMVESFMNSIDFTR